MTKIAICADDYAEYVLKHFLRLRFSLYGGVPTVVSVRERSIQCCQLANDVSDSRRVFPTIVGSSRGILEHRTLWKRARA